jgi:dolichol-phosphate mannosyltransferase
LPSYNEAANVGLLITEILSVAPADVEVLLVDDNSPDGTAKVAARQFGSDPRVRILVRTEGRGFAQAIRSGIECSRGTRVLVMDTDFNHDPRVIPALVGIAPFTDIVSGSRFVPGGAMEDRTRYWASFVYNIAIRVALGTSVRDNLCGYFVMNRDALLRLPLDAIFYGFGDYYFRLLFFAQKVGYRMIEIPISMPLRRAGQQKNQVLRTLLQYSINLVRFRMQLWRARTERSR